MAMRHATLGRSSTVLFLMSLLPLLVSNSRVQADQPERVCAVGELLEVSGRLYVGQGEGLMAMESSESLCLGCHDGTVAAGVQKGNRVDRAPQSSLLAVSLPSTGNGLGSLPGANHPVGMLYPEYGPEMVPRGRLDPRLKLEAGRVGCSTCHSDPDAPGALSVSNSGSALCLSCHDK